MRNENAACHDRRVLTREGIRYQGIRWHSAALLALRDRLGSDAQVIIRIDPTDLTHAFVLDDDERCWVRADLVMQIGLELHGQGLGAVCATEPEVAGHDPMAQGRRASDGMTRSTLWKMRLRAIERLTRSLQPELKPEGPTPPSSATGRD